ncbi:LANO_0H19240g1_1 [Lachancea nothofagi CBS 11611]|uniref:LANO_0H19240g1_1 n=1 Tax=Lachancea nothofagi CBS 11611 TaxID=1266666 RepID=A0A1G4KNC4_9SACH|nr:LANO_0H19240g1_1 [Lachancea nothofagi CBS 11611]
MLLNALALGLIFIARFFVTSQAADNSHTGIDDDFPDPLNAAQFDTEMSKHLHVVEFYSPYCHHCKALAPIWKNAWRNFRDEGRKLNISFAQINCVESGDLCHRERITAYPAIKLYGPNGFIKDFPLAQKRNLETLTNFARQEAMNADNFDTGFLKSQSHLLKGTEFLSLLAGNAEGPHLVSFWPSKNLMTTDDSSIEFENCDDCHSFQNTWTVLSNKLISENFTINHLNCESEMKICRELGFSDLTEITNHRADRSPHVVLIVPKKKAGNLFYYEGDEHTVRDYEDFARRTTFNAQAPTVSNDVLGQLISEPFQMKKSPGSPDGSIHIVFRYEPDTVVQEDFDILEHLIKPVSNIPNAYLHKSTDDLLSFSHELFKSMYGLINYNPGEEAKLPNEEFFSMSAITQYPTFFMFKQGSTIPNIFHGYSTTEMRDFDLITEWIEQDSLPLLNELTPVTYLKLLEYHPELYHFMAIQLVNTSTEAELSRSLDYIENFRLSAFDYESIRNDYLMETVAAERKTKDEAVRAMKAKHAASADIVKKMRDEITHEKGHRVLLTFLDLSTHDWLLAQAGLQPSDRNYRNGEVLIVDKKSCSTYVERDSLGEILRADTPFAVKDTLSRLSFPSRYNSDTIERVQIQGSNRVRFSVISSISEHGFVGYVLILALIVFAVRVPKMLRKISNARKYRSRRDTTGLLGKEKSKD